MIARTITDSASPAQKGFSVHVGFFETGEKKEKPFEVDVVNVADLTDESLKKAVAESVARFQARNEAQTRASQPITEHKLEF